MFIFQFVNLRWWIKNEIKINQVNLSEIPPARNVFQQAHIDMLPEGITTSGVVSYVPLQNLLDHSTKRYLCVCVFLSSYIIMESSSSSLYFLENVENNTQAQTGL